MIKSLKPAQLEMPFGKILALLQCQVKLIQQCPLIWFHCLVLPVDSNGLGPSLAITKALEDTIRGRSQVSHELLQLKTQQIHSPWLCFAGGCL